MRKYRKPNLQKQITLLITKKCFSYSYRNKHALSQKQQQKKQFETDHQLMSNCQNKDLNLALDLVHPHQDSALNHIS